MRMRRFHVSNLSGEEIVLRGEQANHALRVLRLGPGESVTLFDGRGTEVEAIIVAVRPGECVTRVVRRERRPATADLIVAAAAPKGERADWMVEKLAELGVAALTWLECERSAVRPGPARMRRWRRKAVEAAKQSGCARVMDVCGPASLASVLGEAPIGSHVWYADPDPGLPPLAAVLRARGRAAADLILIGPEGGWTDGEKSLMAGQGGQAIRLAAPILRIETAAVTAAAIRAHELLGLPHR